MRIRWTSLSKHLKNVSLLEQRESVAHFFDRTLRRRTINQSLILLPTERYIVGDTALFQT